MFFSADAKHAGLVCFWNLFIRIFVLFSPISSYFRRIFFIFLTVRKMHIIDSSVHFVRSLFLYSLFIFRNYVRSIIYLRYITIKCVTSYNAFLWKCRAFVTRLAHIRYFYSYFQRSFNRLFNLSFVFGGRCIRCIFISSVHFCENFISFFF